MQNKPHLLIFDDDHVVRDMRVHFEILEYTVTGLSKADFIEDVVARNKIDIILLAIEMRTGGPTLGEDTGEPVPVQFANIRDTVIDYDFGLKLMESFKKKSIKQPVILTTTETTESIVKPGDFEGQCVAVVSKYRRNFFDQIITAIDKIWAI